MKLKTLNCGIPYSLICSTSIDIQLYDYYNIISYIEHEWNVSYSWPVNDLTVTALVTQIGSYFIH